MYREILEPIVRSPELPILLKELQQIWEEEQIRRTEFYDWVTPDIKAEFIEGEIIMHSPVRSKHNTVLNNISGLVRVFVLSNDLGYIGVKKIMCRFSRNDYEPDMVFFDAKIAEGFTEDQTIFPVPQLVVEVLSNSTEYRDRGVKFQDYGRHGVQEYWIVDAYKNVIEQYFLAKSKYVLHQKLSGDDEIESSVISGFKTSVKTFFDEKTNIKAILNQ